MYRWAALAAAAAADPSASTSRPDAARREPALSQFDFQQPPAGYFPALFSEMCDLSPPEARAEEAGVRWLARGTCVDFARGFFATDENGAEEPAAQRARRFGAYDLERACMACGVLPPAEGVKEEKQQAAKKAAAGQGASARPAAQVVAVEAVPIAGKHPGWRDVLVSGNEFAQCALRRVAAMRPVCGDDAARARLLAGSLQTAAEEEAQALETDVLRLQEISRIRRGAGGVRELDAATKLDAQHPHLRDSAGSASTEAGQAAGAPPEGLGERQLSFLAPRGRRVSTPDSNSAQDEDIVQKSAVSKRPFGQRVAEARPIDHAERSSEDETTQRVREERDDAPVAFPIADLPKAEKAEPAADAKEDEEEQASAGPMPAGEAPPSTKAVLPEFSTAPADVSVVFTGECLEEPLVSFHLYAAVRDRILELRVEEERVREELMRSKSERVELG